MVRPYLASQGYKSKTSAKNGIASVQKNAADTTRFECKDTRGGQCVFNLRAMNGQVIGTSESYKTTRAQQNGIKSVQKNAPGAKIVDLTAA